MALITPRSSSLSQEHKLTNSFLLALRSGWHLEDPTGFIQHFPSSPSCHLKQSSSQIKPLNLRKSPKKCSENFLFFQLSLQNAHMAPSKRAELEHKELLMLKHTENATESKRGLVTPNIWSIKNSPVQMMKQFIKKWMQLIGTPSKSWQCMGIVPTSAGHPAPSFPTEELVLIRL